MTIRVQPGLADSCWKQEKAGRQRAVTGRLEFSAARPPEGTSYHCEFLCGLRAALAPEIGVGIIDNNRPTRDHGPALTLLRREPEALGYRQVDFTLLTPADGYLAVFVLPDRLPPVEAIKPCKQ